MTRIASRKTVHPRKLKNTVPLRKVSVFNDSGDKVRFSRKGTIRKKKHAAVMPNIPPKLSAFNRNIDVSYSFSDYKTTCSGCSASSLPLSHACTSNSSIHSYAAIQSPSNCERYPEEISQNDSIRKWNNDNKLEMTPDSKGRKNWRSIHCEITPKEFYREDSTTIFEEIIERSQSDSLVRCVYEKNVPSTSSLPVTLTPLVRRMSTKRKSRKLAFRDTPISNVSLESASFGSRDCVDFSSIHKTPEVTAADDVMGAFYALYKEFDEFYTGEMSVDVPLEWRTPEKCKFPPFFNPSATSTPLADLEWVGGLTTPRRLCEKPKKIDVKPPSNKLKNMYRMLMGK